MKPSRTRDHGQVSAFADLLHQPGVREVYQPGHGPFARFGIMAYHGGNLELETDRIASAVARRTGASLYAVLQPPPMRDHISSTRVSPADSTTMTEFFDHVDTVITLHGYGRRNMFTSLLLGGQNRTLAEHIGLSLRSHLPAYDIVTDLERIPAGLRGLHSKNPVNLARLAGVQIELPPRVRGTSPLWWDWEGPGPTPHTQALITGLADAITDWMSRTQNS